MDTHIVPSLLNFSPHLPTHPILLGYHRVLDLSSQCPNSRFPLAIYFTHGDIHGSGPLSQPVSSSPSPTVCKSLLTMSVFPLLPFI